MVDSGGACGFDRGLVVADDGEKVAVADELDRPLGGAADCVFVDRADRCAAVGLAHDARMHHSVKLHVVNKDGFAEHLRRQIDARAAFADALEIGDALARAGAGRFGGQVDRAGQGPVILPGRGAVAQNAAVADRQLGRFAAEDLSRLGEEQCAHVGAGLPHGDAAELDRLAAGGIALVRRLDRLARADGDALHRQIELVGGNLPHCGEHALAKLDAAGEHGDLARRGEGDPAVELGIGLELGGKRRAHREAPARIAAAAFSTARMMRLCEPQRQILPSSACAISPRVGFGFWSSRAFAEIRMPDRQ